jgi:hypothetical protein
MLCARASCQNPPPHASSTHDSESLCCWQAGNRIPKIYNQPIRPDSSQPIGLQWIAMGNPSTVSTTLHHPRTGVQNPNQTHRKMGLSIAQLSAFPREMTSFAFNVRLGTLPNTSWIVSRIAGIREEPPTTSTAATSAGVRLASFNACQLPKQDVSFHADDRTLCVVLWPAWPQRTM